MTKRDFYNELIKLESPKILYLLGFIWGDGHIRRHNNGYSSSVQLVIQREDGLKIKSIFEDMEFVKIYEKQQKNRKPSIDFCIYCKEIYQWFFDNGYKSKSWESPEKLLKKIPEHLRHYWFRGLVDADGNVSFKKQSLAKKKNKPWMTSIITIYSGIEQDWGYIESLYNSLGIKYKITKRTRQGKDKIHHSSEIRISKRNDIIRLGEYLWKNKETDLIGLDRKWKILQEIKKYDKEYGNHLF